MNHATIIGLGLIGGSVGKALIRNGWRVAFIDPAVAFEEADRAGAAHEKLGTLDEIDPSSVVVIAMPVDVSAQMLEQIPPIPNVITTVCSVMQPFNSIGRRRDIRVVAGHPLAGSELRGLFNANAELFSAKRWFVDGTVEHGGVDRMVEAVGAEIVWVDPAEHDRALALTSHLPQLLSTALAAAIHESGVEVDLFAGSGLVDFLRLAGSDRLVWHSVFESNGENLAGALDRLSSNVRQLLEGDDEEVFERAQDLYAQLKR